MLSFRLVFTLLILPNFAILQELDEQVETPKLFSVSLFESAMTMNYTNSAVKLFASVQ